MHFSEINAKANIHKGNFARMGPSKGKHLVEKEEF